MPVDLHTHSTYSDGSDSPAQLVAAAEAAGLEAVALTDHDNLNGILEAATAAEASDVELIPGVELSCEWPSGGMHLVVLWLEPGPGPLQDRLEHLQEGRRQRNLDLIQKLQALEVDISLEEVAAEAGGTGIGRPHVAAVMVQKGVVDSIPEAFELYLAAGRPAYVERFRLPPEEAIELARASGAVPIIAHPHTLGMTGQPLDDQLRRLASYGLVGLECYYPEYRADIRLELVERARDVGLVPSGGSDYHGTYKPGLEIGRGYGDLSVGREVWLELAEARS